MKVVPGSHLDVEHDPDDQSIWMAPQYADDPRIRDMVMDPGDVALWSAYTVHGGGFNTTESLDRRLYINGFVKAGNLHGTAALYQTAHVGVPTFFQAAAARCITRGRSLPLEPVPRHGFAIHDVAFTPGS